MQHFLDCWAGTASPFTGSHLPGARLPSLSSACTMGMSEFVMGVVPG